MHVKIWSGFQSADSTWSGIAVLESVVLPGRHPPCRISTLAWFVTTAFYWKFQVILGASRDQLEVSPASVNSNRLTFSIRSADSFSSHLTPWPPVETSRATGPTTCSVATWSSPPQNGRRDWPARPPYCSRQPHSSFLPLVLELQGRFQWYSRRGSSHGIEKFRALGRRKWPFHPVSGRRSTCELHRFLRLGGLAEVFDWPFALQGHDFHCCCPFLIIL